MSIRHHLGQHKNCSVCYQARVVNSLASDADLRRRGYTEKEIARIRKLSPQTR